MLNLLLIVYICLFVHLFSIAAAGRVASVRLLEISIGMGPALFRYKKFVLKLIPIGGYVKFLDSQEHYVSDADLPFAFDQLSLVKKILVILPGCAALLLLAMALNGADAWQDFCTFPMQFVTGALSPFDTAQTLLHTASKLIQTSGFLSLMGIVAAKLAAGNLLPLVSTNGSQLIIFVAQRLGLVKPYPGPIHKFVAIVSIACWISWLLAIVSTPVIMVYGL
ncbi:hypothetical protein UNDYM_4142 [Undibacterium sp. YM2]|uniref:site-2 protease family protein n=1 Tax=Undibacterium sp. YM2 TaxID=2058625 RepID=UPI001331EC6A|nr:site-2 protease family protein [Undibacterium sp. YM2]BBB68395.1 hypothetical protein UNDYM_4142 [Undibacterium sp. YM2]